jgi:hypothetical protein
MLGVVLSLFETVDLSARHFRHRRRRPHLCSPQQHQIRSDVWYGNRTKFLPKLIGPAETTEVCSSRRRSRQSFAKPIPLEMGKPFRETQGEVDFSADILDFYADNAESFLAPDRSMRGRALFAVGGVPLDRSPEDLQEVGK